MKPIHQRIRRHAAGLIGLVFLLSGLLKVADPVGTGLQVAEYFRFLHLAALAPAAKGVGIFFALLECSVGIGLITGVLRKFSAWVVCILLGLFTSLTLALWLSGSEMDCGCFGQALHLTPLQSFLKNVVLILLAVLAFTPFKEFGRAKVHRSVAAVLALGAVGFASIYSNSHLPVVDFTPFNWGSQLLSSLDEEDTEEDFRRAPVLSFWDTGGVYCDSLAAAGRVVAFSVYDPAKADWERLEQQYRAVSAHPGVRPLLLVAGGSAPLRADIPVYEADGKTLITLNRSNGGGSYFYEGEIIHKWAAGHYPEDLPDQLAQDPVNVSTRHVVRRRVSAQGFCVVLAVILMLV